MPDRTADARDEPSVAVAGCNVVAGTRSASVGTLRRRRPRGSPRRAGGFAAEAPPGSNDSALRLASGNRSSLGPRLRGGRVAPSVVLAVVPLVMMFARDRVARTRRRTAAPLESSDESPRPG